MQARRGTRGCGKSVSRPEQDGSDRRRGGQEIVQLKGTGTRKEAKGNGLGNSITQASRSKRQIRGKLRKEALAFGCVSGAGIPSRRMGGRRRMLARSQRGSTEMAGRRGPLPRRWVLGRLCSWSTCLEGYKEDLFEEQRTREVNAGAVVVNSMG